MFPASTKGGGTCFVFPDVCKTPAPPAPFVPIPYPNISQCASASGGTVSKKVKICNHPVIHQGSEIPNSNGDEAGTLKGMVSSVNMDKTTFKTYSAKVFVEGSKVVTHLKMTAQNGSNANNPAGTQVAPSQVKVIIGG